MAIRAASIERSLNAGQTLFRSGNRVAGLYEVVNGTVRLARVNRAGGEAVLHIATAGDTLAEASLFPSTYHCDANRLNQGHGPALSEGGSLGRIPTRHESRAGLYGNVSRTNHEPQDKTGTA
jgi:CRP-like cAMP-binding protein